MAQPAVSAIVGNGSSSGGTVIEAIPKGKRYTDVVPVTKPADDAGALTTSTKRKRRPARRQVDERKSATELPAQTGQVFNIWYGQWSGGDRWDPAAQGGVPAETRCNPARDSGWTQADRAGVVAGATYFCLYFARGCCAEGPECKFLHRIPRATDIFPPNVDCFGRDKHADYRDDMGGVGSFLRQNHTLYVGRITIGDAVEEQVSTQFTVWGDVERIRILNGRGVAFVTYANVASAEFAKEAMHNQTLGNGETLNVKWATQDPNPAAAARDAKRTEEQAAAAIRRALPQEFVDELEGKTDKKQKRLDFGLDGYQPTDELWYQRGEHAINPVGRPAPQKTIEQADDAPEAHLKIPSDGNALINGRTLAALEALRSTKSADSNRKHGLQLDYGSDDE
ncbi:Pre-mRNA-splicing factor [Savitreella phatthalungensis]